MPIKIGNDNSLQLDSNMIPGKYYKWVGDELCEDENSAVDTMFTVADGSPYKLISFERFYNGRRWCNMIQFEGYSGYQWDDKNKIHFVECESPVMEGSIQ